MIYFFREMKRTNLFRKLNFLIAFAAFFVAAIFCGCGNLLSSAEIGAEENVISSQPREGYGTVSGVLPSTQSPNARTAMPSSSQFSDVSYNVFAINDSDKILADVKPDGTFFITLPFGTWRAGHWGKALCDAEYQRGRSLRQLRIQIPRGR